MPQVQVLPGAPNNSIASGPLSSCSSRQVAPGLRIPASKLRALGSSPRRLTAKIHKIDLSSKHFAAEPNTPRDSVAKALKSRWGHHRI